MLAAAASQVKQLRSTPCRWNATLVGDPLRAASQETISGALPLR